MRDGFPCGYTDTVENEVRQRGCFEASSAGDMTLSELDVLAVCWRASGRRGDVSSWTIFLSLFGEIGNAQAVK
jgi:hypothetical protein